MSGRSSLVRWAAGVVIIGLSVAIYVLRPAADKPAPGQETVVAGAVAEAPLPRLLDLGADKCVPCKAMAPILEEMKAEYAGLLVVDFIDVWKDPTAAQPYGLRVIPTQIFFAADGRELFRHEGFYGREDILAKWRELGVELPDRGV